MNNDQIEILKKVQTFFQEEPRRLEMDVWFSDQHSGPLNPPCGTIGCMAYGIVRVVESKDYIPLTMTWAQRAREILNLTERQTDQLFYIENWPEPFRSDYQQSQYDYSKLRYNALTNNTANELAVCLYLKKRMVSVFSNRINAFCHPI